MSIQAIVLAAGRAERFGGAKQFALLAGRPLVDHVVLTASAVCDSCVVVLPRTVPWNGAPVAAVTAGGATRAESVRAGLAAVRPTTEIVVIADAAHPLASEGVYRAVVKAI